MPIHPWPSSSPFSPPDQQRTTPPCVPSQPLQQNQSRIVAETLVPGTSVAEAARRRNMNANMLFIWRPEVGQGRLPAVAPQPKGADKSAAMEFIPIGVIGRDDGPRPISAAPRCKPRSRLFRGSLSRSRAIP
ncbi:MAG: hypothetical protein E5V27_09185 [Mesorhizobium sp.]|nr:MAG: hypothetical protein E5V27_09185 [Mesorhizobium sp.]